MASLLLRTLVLASVVAVGLWLPRAEAEPTFPALTGRVVDDADLLTSDDETALIAELEALEQKSSDQLVVVTLPSLQGYTIEDYGYQLGRHWGIGTAKLNNGALLIVAPNERKVRIEVGYGLEPILTDALTKIIIENAILPRFRAGDFASGIKDGVHDIVLSLTGDAAEVEARARARPDADQSEIDWIFVLVWTLIIAWVVWSMYRSAKYGNRTGRSNWGSGSSGGWSSGGGGGGWSSGGGGGGFSGGGGSFGGGGSSGSW
jgi:uncharacterized protein